MLCNSHHGHSDGLLSAGIEARRAHVIPGCQYPSPHCALLGAPGACAACGGPWERALCPQCFPERARIQSMWGLLAALEVPVELVEAFRSSPC